MNKKEMYEFLTANPMGFMATVEGNKPHVRGMAIFRADENGIIYFTNHHKKVCQQLLANPETEVCYFANGTQLRVSGRVEEIKDNKIKQEIVDKNQFLKPNIEKYGLDFMAVFRLKPVEASTWTMQNLTGDPVPVDL
jgi:pyridoxamine 5'-phosphate oxidase